ncbi:MAG: hypothetical protein JW958_10140 [Candidatus Eisenbacteria bacterium]|nr:hypothetical protein [Candidatus Eisenbacteria bacterium]
MRSKRFRTYFLLLTFGLMLALSLAYSRNLRAEEPCIQGKMEAWRSGDALGEWTYRILLHWEVGGAVGPDEFLILLGLESCPCVCERFQVAFPDTVGFSMNEPGMSTGNHTDLYVHYTGEFDCRGFPGAPGVPAIRIAPLPDPNGPGPKGTAEILFHANWPPESSPDSPGAYLMMRTPGGAFSGSLEGLLPVCRCLNDVRKESWSSTKKRFR